MVKSGLIFFSSILLVLININSKGQSFELSKDSASILISGTSTLHNWKMYVKIFDCDAGFVMNGSQLKGIDNVSFKCNATDIKSDNSSMDKKAYTALKSKTFPLITFNMISVSEILLNNNKFSGNIKGNLFIAGKSNVISIHLNGILNNNKGNAEIDIKGETELKMSNFDISPPVFMMGALKTGDKIDVSFSLPFIRKSG